MEREKVGLPLDLLRDDGGTQIRAKINYDHVDALCDLLLESAVLEPVEVLKDAEGQFWLWDGFHRVKAHRKAGRQMLYCYVEPGTQREAVLRAVGANTGPRGLPRDRGTCRNAVETMLRDTEWSQWSDGRIAEQAEVSRQYVNKLRTTMSGSQGATVAPPEQRVGRDGKVRETGHSAEINRQRTAERRERLEVLEGERQERIEEAKERQRTVGTFTPGRDRARFSEDLSEPETVPLSIPETLQVRTLRRLDTPTLAAVVSGALEQMADSLSGDATVLAAWQQGLWALVAERYPAEAEG